MCVIRHALCAFVFIMTGINATSFYCLSQCIILPCGKFKIMRIAARTDDIFDGFDMKYHYNFSAKKMAAERFQD